MLTGQLEVMEKTTQRAAQANGTSTSEQIVVGGTKQDREGEVKSLPILCSPFSEILMVLLIILMLFLEKEGEKHLIRI